uniref:BESS domain-containing protein n=1 Tax=Timema poppense TaxID=170557 RepID=A0A7R9DUF5_TIMPO|nr:unnamed protein product [Timema poppensis]
MVNERYRGLVVIYVLGLRERRRRYIMCRVSEELCRRRWRTLRDTYIKEVRAREAGTTRNKKKRWHWYHHMAFMLPHVGSVVCVEDSSDPLFCVKMETTSHEESAGASTEDYLVTTSFQGNEGSAPRLEEEGEMDTAQDPVLGWVDDPDAQFLISYLPTFKRLTPRQNALARLKIQQVLYQVEFGDL